MKYGIATAGIHAGYPREHYLGRVRKALGRNPVVALLGPRQCGKTTLARQIVPAGHPQYFDLEDPVIAHLLDQPMTALQGLRGLVVIDEAQRQPALFPVLRVLADRADQPATFLILGSASPDFSRQTAESLAGRVEIIEILLPRLRPLPHPQWHPYRCHDHGHHGEHHDDDEHGDDGGDGGGGITMPQPPVFRSWQLW